MEYLLTPRIILNSQFFMFSIIRFFGLLPLLSSYIQFCLSSMNDLLCFSKALMSWSFSCGRAWIPIAELFARDWETKHQNDTADDMKQ